MWGTRARRKYCSDWGNSLIYRIVLANVTPKCAHIIGKTSAVWLRCMRVLGAVESWISAILPFCHMAVRDSTCNACVWWPPDDSIRNYTTPYTWTLVNYINDRCPFFTASKTLTRPIFTANSHDMDEHWMRSPHIHIDRVHSYVVDTSIWMFVMYLAARWWRNWWCDWESVCHTSSSQKKSNNRD